MVDRGTNEFRIRFDDEESEALESAPPNRQTQRQLRRHRNLFVGLSLVMVALLVAAYYDLKTRLTQLDTVGGQEVQSLSQNLASRFSSLSIQQAQLEKEIASKTKHIAEINKKLAASSQALTKSITTAEKTISRNLDIKIDPINSKLESIEQNRQQLADTIARLQESLITIQNSLDATAGEIASLDINFTQELAVLAANIENAIGDISKLKTDVAAFSTDIVEIGYLDSRLQKEQRIFQLKLDQVTRDMRERFTQLEKALQSARQQSSVAPPPGQVSGKAHAAQSLSPALPLSTNTVGPSAEIQSNADNITEESLQ
jgi:chromosome segregation ATPase